MTTAAAVQAALASQDLGDRLSGINQLRQLPPDVAFELIQPVIHDPNPRVRYAAVSQLSSLGNCNLDKAQALLCDRLHNDGEVDVKAAAADAIGALKLSEAFADLASVYSNTSEWLLQFSIVAALGELGNPAATPLLLAALDTDQELLKLAAIGSLGELGDRAILPVLASYIDYPDWQVRHRLAIALGQIGGAQADSLLHQLSQDSSSTVAETATTLLAMQSA
ncbi:HEAT repeat domain-containing protein [Thermosynechococcaceae cyanobacterium BACA0444]|uniref:HEAT repeat domain-containing protein n=1 Tax=Pseudocalidococcus azoricus BACA0444 TaxID=2918990 RepID=A0AAE4JW75_9CYAN|nr:HEAT repeat domain-containing protein [Pseudocalidococcus azoricus]MDS3860771.1 HEAT repeat domain-containing protein [Pseudocalidococcus azoricus BACA0444]